MLEQGPDSVGERAGVSCGPGEGSELLRSELRLLELVVGSGQTRDAPGGPETIGARQR